MRRLLGILALVPVGLFALAAAIILIGSRAAHGAPPSFQVQLATVCAIVAALAAAAAFWPPYFMSRMPEPPAMPSHDQDVE